MVIFLGKIQGLVWLFGGSKVSRGLYKNPVSHTCITGLGVSSCPDVSILLVRLFYYLYIIDHDSFQLDL